MFDISGSLHLRDKGVTGDGRKLVMVVGVIAVPGHLSLTLPFEHLCQVSGYRVGNVMDWFVSMDKDHTLAVPECSAYTANQLLTSPIWRVASAKK